MRWLRQFLDAFKAPTLTDVIEGEPGKATLEAEQAKHVIHSHEFQLHMARARIRALEEWNHASDSHQK